MYGDRKRILQVARESLKMYRREYKIPKTGNCILSYPFKHLVTIISIYLCKETLITCLRINICYYLLLIKKPSTRINIECCSYKLNINMHKYEGTAHSMWQLKHVPAQVCRTYLLLFLNKRSK
jgi:hypothetical protein